MDWVWFWGALGEVARNAGALLVGVVGIVATYKAGSRSLQEQTRRESEATKRGMYADYMSVAGEIVDYLGLLSATFSAVADNDARLGETRRSRASVFPVNPGPEVEARLSRGAALIQLLEPDADMRGAVSDLHTSLVGALVMANKSALTPKSFDELVSKTVSDHYRTIQVLRVHLNGR